MKKYAVIISLLLTIIHATAREQYIYSQISREEGLTSTVNCIHKEKDGDVWIGTPDGLYSFNGYSLKNFSSRLPGSRKVFHIDMDPDGNLWVLTDRAVFRRDAQTDTFTKVSADEDSYFCMVCDENSIWIGSLSKVYRYNRSDRSFRPAFNTPKGLECRTICLLDENTLLCGSHSGKIFIDIRSGDIADAPYGTINAVSDILIDSRGRVWSALYNNGIEVYEKDGTLIRRYDTSNSLLSNDLVLCLAEHGTSMLAGTDGGGINIINLEDDTIHVLSHISGDRSSFPAHSIKSIHTDHYGNIWAGSVRDGLISISQSGINSYQDTHLGLNDGLSNPTVLCLHQDRHSGQIWIGTDGEGLNRFDPESSTFRHFPGTFKTKVVSVADYSRDELAISTYADRILIFDKNTGKTRPMPFSNPDFRHWVSHSGRSINLYNEEDGDLLLFANIIYRYDRRDGSCTPIESSDKKRSYSNFLMIGRDQDGVWLHNNSDIFLLPDNATVLIFKGTHSNGIINSGHMDRSGMIWLATEEGLCNFDPRTGRFSHIGTTIFNEVNSVICDNHMRVWVGTEKGLSAYLPSSASFSIFGESDGAEPNEYLPKPRLLASNGDVYLGGVQGLRRIREEHIIDSSEEPVLRLSEISADGTEVKCTGGALLKVPRNSKSMNIGVSVQEKDMFRHRIYRFTFSDGKIYETSSPQLALPQLPAPGKYGITVSCTKRNGEWTRPVDILTLKVPQPWYMTWWFIGSCLLLMAGIFVTVIIAGNRRKTAQMKMALKEREQKVYEEKVGMLINISHELRTPLTLIMAPLKRILKDMDSGHEHFLTLGRIYRQSRRMRGLLDMVLDLRKLEVGMGGMKKEETVFNGWIADIADDIVSEEKAEGISIEYDLDSNIGTAEIDRRKCETVLMNILMNAIKHSDIGDTITISTRLTENGMIRTSISDQGPGLGKDIDPDRMFTRFYQSNSERYGSGIGLSYSKILVELHGGSIGVFNNHDRGATFWWEVPAAAPDTSAAVAPRAYLNELLGHSSEADTCIIDNEDFNTTGMRLMIVDDNQDLLSFLHEALCQDFAEIITVTGGNAALRVLEGGKLPDIIVSDVNMPDGDGFRLCREVKQNEKYSHIPLVLLTARGEEQSQSDSYRLGADSFLSKPFEIETLMEMLRGLLRSKAEIRRRYLDNESTAETDYGSNEERFIIQFNRIVSEHMSDPQLDQQLICREMGVSRALLYNKMKAITGAGANEYITRIRIEKAKSLIETTPLTIAEISDMTGFASQSYFSTAFKNYTGMTPSKYKQQCKTKEE